MTIEPVFHGVRYLPEGVDLKRRKIDTIRGGAADTDFAELDTLDAAAADAPVQSDTIIGGYA